MKTLRNEKGFALVFVLVLAAITLAITMAMLFMAGQGSFVSGHQRRYRSAGEASRGGMEAIFQEISDGASRPRRSRTRSEPEPGEQACVSHTSWVGLDNTMSINPADNTSFDMRVDLGVYRCVHERSRIRSSGNSGADEGLEKFGTGSGSGEVTVVSVPYLYTIEVLAQAVNNPTDRSRLSVLYPVLRAMR